MTVALKAFWTSAVEQIAQEKVVLARLKGRREAKDPLRESEKLEPVNAAKGSKGVRRAESLTHARIQQFSSRPNSSFYKMCVVLYLIE